MRTVGLAGCFAAVRDADLHPTLGLIEIPTLVIIGEHDTVCLPEHGALNVQAIPNATA